MPEAKVIPIRPLNPSDLVEIVKRLRKFMAAADNAAASLYTDFQNDRLNADAVKAKRHLEAAASKTYDLLLEIEKTEMYLSLQQNE